VGLRAGRRRAGRDGRRRRLAVAEHTRGRVTAMVLRSRTPVVVSVVYAQQVGHSGREVGTVFNTNRA